MAVPAAAAAGTALTVGTPGRQTKYQCYMSKLDSGCPILAAWNPAILVL